jgi:hypothetical protein
MKRNIQTLNERSLLYKNLSLPYSAHIAARLDPDLDPEAQASWSNPESMRPAMWAQ